MKGNASRVLFGLIIILLGALLILRNAGILAGFSFEGWWTLFIILPCLASIFSNGFRGYNTFGLLIGLYLLAWQQNLIPTDLMKDYFWAVLLILFGLWIVFSSFGHGRAFHGFSGSAGDFAEYPDYVAVFSTRSVKNVSTTFKGGKVTAVFGGLDLDLREAVLTGNVRIEAAAVFGSIQILPPKNANLDFKGVPIFGGCNNGASKPFDPSLPTLTVEASAVFGSIDIKPIP